LEKRFKIGPSGQGKEIKIGSTRQTRRGQVLEHYIYAEKGVIKIGIDGQGKGLSWVLLDIRKGGQDRNF